MLKFCGCIKYNMLAYNRKGKIQKIAVQCNFCNCTSLDGFLMYGLYRDFDFQVRWKAFIVQKGFEFSTIAANFMAP